jgi:hypothetical protein
MSNYIESANIAVSNSVNKIVFSNVKKQPLAVSKDVTIAWKNVLAEPPLNNSETTKKELLYLSDLTKELTSEQVRLILTIDKDPYAPFYEVLETKNIVFPKKELFQVWSIMYNIVLNVKYIYNRPRPYQLAGAFGLKINVLETKTHNTPSYPSGHTAQTAVGAYVLAAKYPEYSGEFFDKVSVTGMARMLQGVHYPSDNEASMVLVGAVWENIRYKLFPEFKNF